MQNYEEELWDLINTGSPLSNTYDFDLKCEKSNIQPDSCSTVNSDHSTTISEKSLTQSSIKEEIVDASFIAEQPCTSQSNLSDKHPECDDDAEDHAVVSTRQKPSLAFIGKSNFQRQQHFHAKEYLNKCGKCNKKFKFAANLSRHLKLSGHIQSQPVCIKQRRSIRASKYKFNCRHCQKIFADYRSWQSHERTHTREKLDKRKTHSTDSTKSIYMILAASARPIDQCQYCGKRFPGGGVRRHERLHTGEKPYKCKKCFAAFTEGSPFHRHMRIHKGTDDKPYKCKKCSAAFTRLSSLNCHLGTYSHTGEKPYKCKKCSAAFTRLSSLNRHLGTYSHTGEKPYKCIKCFAAFTEVSHLRRHMRIHKGTDDKSYKCKKCSAAFTRLSSLNRHLGTYSHTGEKSYKCIKCFAAFTEESHLRRHMRIHKGTDDKSYKCKKCSAAFTRLSSLNRHLGTYSHTGEKPYKCKKCSATFVRLSSLCRHMESETHTSTCEKPYECGKCSATFMQPTSLHCHISSHACTISKPYECIVCAATFSRSSSMHRHMRTCKHTVKKPYKCKECSGTFMHLSSLRRHMNLETRISTCEKTYECEECSATFMQLSAFQRHVRSKTHTNTGEKHKCSSKSGLHKCKECSATFMDYSTLNQHMETHTDVCDYKCLYCDKRFTKLKHVSTHESTYHAVKSCKESPIFIENYFPPTNTTEADHAAFTKVLTSTTEEIHPVPVLKIKSMQACCTNQAVDSSLPVPTDDDKETLNELWDEIKNQKTCDSAVKAKAAYDASFKDITDSSSLLVQTNDNKETRHGLLKEKSTTMIQVKEEIQDDAKTPFPPIDAIANTAKVDPVESTKALTSVKEEIQSESVIGPNGNDSLRIILTNEAVDSTQPVSTCVGTGASNEMWSGVENGNSPIRIKEEIQEDASFNGIQFYPSGLANPSSADANANTSKINFAFSNNLDAASSSKASANEDIPSESTIGLNGDDSLQAILTRSFCKCEICGVICANAVTLKKHQIKKHIGSIDGEFYCEYRKCSYTSLVYRRYIIHKSRVHLKSVLPFKCESCSEEFSFFKPFNTHSCDKSHKEDDFPSNFRFKCQICLKNFSESSTMRSHVCTGRSNSKHSSSAAREDVTNNCQYCSGSFSGKEALLEHVQEAHPEHVSKPHKCNVCLFHSDKMSVLRSHMISVHSADFPFSCPICGKGYLAEPSLKKHLKKSHNDQIQAMSENLLKIGQTKTDFKCSDGDDTFTNEDHLQSRIELQHEGGELKRFKCNVCSFSTDIEDDLYEHMKVHPKKKPHRCMMCSKAYAMRCSLDHHLRTHDRDRPFKCTKCDMSYARPDNLKRHMRTAHHQFSCDPFVCKICGKAFEKPTYLNAHTLSDHPHAELPYRREDLALLSINWTTF